MGGRLFRRKFEKKILCYRRLMANLKRPTWDGLIQHLVCLLEPPRCTDGSVSVSQCRRTNFQGLIFYGMPEYSKKTQKTFKNPKIPSLLSPYRGVYGIYVFQMFPINLPPQGGSLLPSSRALLKKHGALPATRSSCQIRVRGSPERDILSLHTLGLGLARFGRPSAGAARPIFDKK